MGQKQSKVQQRGKHRHINNMLKEEHEGGSRNPGEIEDIWIGGTEKEASLIMVTDC